MESTKQIRSIRPIRGQKSNPSSLPFREGQGVGFPLTKREARLTKRACERLTKCEARLTHKKGVPSVPSVSSVSGVSFRFWTKKTPVFGPNRNKTSVSSVSGVSGDSFRFWTKKSPVFGSNRNKTGVSVFQLFQVFRINEVP